MNDIVTRPAEEMSREELYELVWQTPMSKLGAQLATNGPGLAALCRKRQIPTPPLGYWQKKAVGRAPEMPPLPSFEPPQKTSPSIKPARGSGRPLVPASVPSRDAESVAELTPFDENDESLDHMRALHPKVKAWVAEHRQLQESRRAENRQRSRDFWGGSLRHISDLTARDRYRFRVTSTLFRAIEKQGGQIGEAKLTPLQIKRILLVTVGDVTTEPFKPSCKLLVKSSHEGESGRSWRAQRNPGSSPSRRLLRPVRTGAMRGMQTWPMIRAVE